MTDATPPTPRRRRHGAALKAQILAECECPGASIAAVAMAHGINANLVHKWRARAAKRQEIAVVAPGAPFVPVPLATVGIASQVTELRIELRRGPVTATVSWPMSAVAECAAWLREVLR
jgi:transposase